jgi:hypothetical protein
MDSIQIKASTQGGISPIFLSTTTNRVIMGKISTEMSPLLVISSEIKWKSMMTLARYFKPLASF